MREWDIEKFFPKKVSAGGGDGIPTGVASLSRGLSSSNSSTLKADSKLQRCSMADMPTRQLEQHTPKGFQPLKATNQQAKEQQPQRASMIGSNLNNKSANGTSNNSNSNKSSSSTTSSSSSSSSPSATTNISNSSTNSVLSKSATNATHKRQESDSKLPQNFIRGFRRENSDFFPLTKRHSAVLVNTSLLQQQLQSSTTEAQKQNFGSASQKASAMIQRNSIFKNDLNKTKDPANNKSTTKTTSNISTTTTIGATPNKTSWTSNLTGKNLDFLRPRREKTESVITLHNSAVRQQLFAQQLVQQQQSQLQQQQQVKIASTSSSSSTYSTSFTSILQN